MSIKWPNKEKQLISSDDWWYIGHSICKSIFLEFESYQRIITNKDTSWYNREKTAFTAEQDLLAVQGHAIRTL